MVDRRGNDHSGYGLSQWEKALLCNAFSHWLSTYPEWSSYRSHCSPIPQKGIVTPIAPSSSENRELSWCEHFVVIGGTGGCPYDSCRCHRWRQFGIMTILGFQYPLWYWSLSYRKFPTSPDNDKVPVDMMKILLRLRRVTVWLNKRQWQKTRLCQFLINYVSLQNGIDLIDCKAVTC